MPRTITSSTSLRSTSSRLLFSLTLIGISEQTIYTWRKRFGGFEASDVRRLKHLEAENARLKKLVAERDLEIEVMKEVASKNW